MANYSIGDSVYSAGPFSIAHVGTASATLKPVPITAAIFTLNSAVSNETNIVSDYYWDSDLSAFIVSTNDSGGSLIAYVDTELAVLKATPISDSVYAANSFSVSSVDTALAALKPLAINDSVYSTGSFSANYVDTASAVLKPLPISDSVYAAALFSVAHIDTSSATLKPLPISDSVYAAALFSVAYIDASSATLKPLPISDSVYAGPTYSVNFIPVIGNILPSFEAGSATFALTGRSAAMHIALGAFNGSISLAGQDAEFRGSSTLLANTGYFTFSGQNTASGTGIRLAAGGASFSIGSEGSGDEVNIVADFYWNRDFSPFKLSKIGISPPEANLIKGFGLLASAATFVLNSSVSDETSIVSDYYWDSDLSAFIVSTNDSGGPLIADLTVNLSFSANTGAFTFTGVDATFALNRQSASLTASTGSFTLAGQDAALVSGRLPVTVSIAASARAFIISGRATNGFASIFRNTGPGTFYLTGRNAELRKAFGFYAAPASFALTGVDATFHVILSVKASAGSFTLTGNGLIPPVSPWTPNNIQLVGYIVTATTIQASGLWFRCIVSGATGSTEPNWPTRIGGTVVDGTVTWQAISSAYQDLAVFAPSAIIELFQLELVQAIHGSNDIYYFHAGVNANVTGNIIWNGQSYMRLPVQAEGFEYSSGGTLPRPTLSIANLGGEISALILFANAITPGNDLGGAKVTRIRTLKKYLDGQPTADPHAKFPDEIWYVDRKSSESRNLVQWELASKFDLAGMMIPKRQIIANICQWQYRSPECGYAGPPVADGNDKLLSTSTIPELQAYYNAATAYRHAKANRQAKAASLAAAANTLNTTQNTYFLAEERYNQAAGNESYAFDETYDTNVKALWDGSFVSIGTIYRQGDFVESEPIYRGTNTNYYRIQRWQLVNSSAQQTAYNIALNEYNAAASAEATALATAQAARDAYLAIMPPNGPPEDVCSKRLTGCKLRFKDFITDEVGELPFGSFPGAGLTV